MAEVKIVEGWGIALHGLGEEDAMNIFFDKDAWAEFFDPSLDRLSDLAGFRVVHFVAAKSIQVRLA